MRYIKRNLLILSAFVLFLSAAHSQQIDPSWQIGWPSCGTGQAYSPTSNTCEAVILPTPSGAQAITQPSVSQPLTVNYLSQAFSNGVIFADQFCGLGTIGGVTTPACSVDMCVKINSALTYAIANGLNHVDATHFQGTQACSANMFSTSIAGNHNAGVTIDYGVVHIQTTVVQHITVSGLHLRGMGSYQTQLEYTSGTNAAQGILYVDGTTGTGPYAPAANGLNNFSIEGFAVYGGTANANDAIQVVATHRSKFQDLSLWGVTNCGFHSLAAVTDTLSRVHISVIDAFYMNIQSGHTAPLNGLCFDAFGGIQTTNGTVTDSMAEGVTGWGWDLISANSMMFTAGTSEENGVAATSGGGLLISSASKYNTFVSPDIEANVSDLTGLDITDNGGYNTFIEPIASSPCAGGCTATINLTGSGGNDWFIGPADGALYNITGAGVYGFVPVNPGGAGHTIPTTAGGFVPMYVRGALVYIPYFTSQP